MLRNALWRDSDFQREMILRSWKKRATSPKRCVAISKSTGQRCKSLRKCGYDRCNKHIFNFSKTRFNKMSRYAKSMGTTLTQKVAELQSADHPIHSLRDELDFARVLAGDVIALYEAACQTPDEAKREANKSMASALMVNALNNVRDMATAYVKIEKEYGAAMSVEQTQILVSKFAQLMDRVLKEAVRDGKLDDTQAKLMCIRMQELVEDRLVVSNQPHGTTLTPDQDMRDMIDSVPRFEPGEGEANGNAAN